MWKSLSTIPTSLTVRYAKQGETPAGLFSLAGMIRDPTEPNTTSYMLALTLSNVGPQLAAILR